MADTHHTPAATTATGTGSEPDTQWRQGGVIGGAVGLALSVVLSIGLAPTRFPGDPDGLWLTRAIGVAAGVAIGACIGLAIGSVTPIDPATRRS